jgi:hypothetical protein
VKKRHRVGSGKLARAVEATRKYHACHDLPIKTQQRFYARMTRAIDAVASEHGMSAVSASDQIHEEAKRQGPLRLSPGKDY